MSHHRTRMSDAETCQAVRQRILEAIPGAEVHVEGGGGHYAIAVVASQFEGLNTLKKKRLVYSAIKDLMAGDDAPVHAVDRLETSTP